MEHFGAHWAYFAYFHFLMKLLMLHFPCFDDALCEIHPSGDLIIGNVALTNVQKKPTKVSVLNYID